MRKPWVWLVFGLLLRAAANGWVTAHGFSAISDDDFARVVIAQNFARDPQWDPSGSSWLPFPFWLTGTVMAIGGTDIGVARTLSWLTSELSVLGVFIASRWVGSSVAWSLFAACAFAVLPHAVWLGLATVPEGYAAVLALLALASLCRADLRTRALGGLCLFAATLSRYEAWPLAPILAAFNLFDALAPCGVRVIRTRAGLAAVAALSLMGPLAWLIHGELAHGDGLFFLKRVANYRQALAQGPQDWGDVLSNYPWALLTREPEAVVFAGTVLGIGLARHCRAEGAIAAKWPLVASRLLSGVGAVLLFLMIGDCLNGAPTHHPERPLLLCWLVLLLLGTYTLAQLRLGTRTVGTVLAVSAAASAVRCLQPPLAFVDRSHELALGRELAPRLSANQRLFVETNDYGYLAVMAATGRPWWVVARNPHDPRQTDDVWASTSILQRFLQHNAVGWLAVYQRRWENAADVARHAKQVGEFAIFRFTRTAEAVENSDALRE